jgi:hypothetical protein
MELSTERQSGMGVGSIPVSMVWKYLDRFDLPDWWEPVLLQADAAIVSDMRNDSGTTGKKNKERATA